ncbi:MAG: hypothetical protein CFE34_03065 [Rhodobacteraceae bacterium PARR1]|nr:MAG: hypothetical protein CFE34_03065 [Rhodobacteraceae bacterium PARR1]
MDFADQITAGEQAVAAGRADAAIALADGLYKAGCTDVAVFVFHARALDLALRPLAALTVLADGLATHPLSGRLRVERGKILARQGDAAQAEAAFDDALTVDPRQMEAVKGILSLRPMPLDDPRLALVTATAMDTDRPPNKRAKPFYILGQVWLEAGEIDPAMAFYAQANALMALGHDPAAQEYRFASGAFDITREVLAEHPRTVPLTPNCPAVLIAGLPRSGKTLAEKLLTRSGGVHAGGELALLSRYARELDWTQGAGAVVAGLATLTQSPLARRYTAAAEGRRFVTDTSPPTLFRLGVMAALHPDVPVVLCHRDPLDLAAAMYVKQFRRGNLFTTRLDTLGRAIARAERLMAHWLDTLPNPVLHLAYEDTARDPDDTTRHLAALIGQPAPPRTEARPPKRLHPARASDGPPGPALIGFARPLARHLKPAMAAYHAEKERLSLSRPR